MTPKAKPEYKAESKPKPKLRVSASPREKSADDQPQSPNSHLPSPPPPTPQEVVTLLPAHKHQMTVKEAKEALRGKATSREVQAMISLMQWGREDALNAGMNPVMSEREAGYYAGFAAALREQEKQIQNFTQPEK